LQIIRRVTKIKRFTSMVVIGERDDPPVVPSADPATCKT